MADWYEPYVVVAGEGHRLALASCKKCGATVDMSDAASKHIEWHQSLPDVQNIHPTDVEWGP